MTDLQLVQSPQVLEKFQSYPIHIQPKLQYLRHIILKVATEIDAITAIEETLKWGEPSYLVKKGSTVRMDWKAKSPQQYALYFKCTSKLVLTFREIYGDLFHYEKNRAIVFGLNDEVPTEELKVCIRMALQYHTVKHLPRLGHS